MMATAKAASTPDTFSQDYARRKRLAHLNRKGKTLADEAKAATTTEERERAEAQATLVRHELKLLGT